MAQKKTEVKKVVAKVTVSKQSDIKPSLSELFRQILDTSGIDVEIEAACVKFIKNFDKDTIKYFHSEMMKIANIQGKFQTLYYDFNNFLKFINKNKLPNEQISFDDNLICNKGQLLLSNKYVGSELKEILPEIENEEIHTTINVEVNDEKIEEELEFLDDEEASKFLGEKTESKPEFLEEIEEEKITEEIEDEKVIEEIEEEKIIEEIEDEKVTEEIIEKIEVVVESKLDEPDNSLDLPDESVQEKDSEEIKISERQLASSILLDDEEDNVVTPTPTTDEVLKIDLNALKEEYK